MVFPAILADLVTTAIGCPQSPVWHDRRYIKQKLMRDLCIDRNAQLSIGRIIAKNRLYKCISIKQKRDVGKEALLRGYFLSDVYGFQS